MLGRTHRLAATLVGGWLCAAIAGAQPTPAAPAGGDLRAIRRVTSQRLRLATDLPPSPPIEALGAAFDAATPQWAAYFEIPAARWAGWRVEGHLVGRRELFAAAGMLPAENPSFINGYARSRALWFDDQPSDYYRLHLLLHEGTHAFMYEFLGGAGPGWFMEGMAERLATHAWPGGRLALAQVPASREAAPQWGRIALVRDACRDGVPLALDEVLAIDNRRVLTTAEYAWCWALVTLLDEDPRYRPTLRTLLAHVTDDDKQFNRRFRYLLRDTWSQLQTDWDAYLAELDYGYDYARMQTVHATAQPAAEDAAEVPIAADRGWQSTGWLLRAGETYEFTARGRFQVGDQPRPWISEPDGVTLRYVGGLPLGTLVGALQPAEAPRTGRAAAAGPTFFAPARLGTQSSLTPTRDAVLYVKINDAASSRGDNAGQLTLRREPRGARN
jgi:hypothetical protein